MASFIAASAVAYSGYGAVDVALPAGLSAGDGLFAFVMVEGSDASVTMPSGWDAITVSGTPVAVTANITLRAYRRTRQAGDADVISISASAISQAVTILAFGALGAATVFAANSTGFANQPPSISVTTTSANQWLLYVAGIGTQGRTMTPPAGMTQPAAVASGGSSGSSFVSMGAAYQGPIAAGTYARQATWDGGSPTGALLLAIAEDAGGGGGGIAGDLTDQTTAAGSAAATSAIAAAAADRPVQTGSAAGSTAITANLSHGLDAVLGSLYGTAAIAAAAAGGVACDGSAAGTVAITADAAQTTTQTGDLSAAAVATRQADIDGAIAITVGSDASSAISAGMAQRLDAVLGSYSGSAAIASTLLGDAAASSAAEAGNAIAAGTAGSVSTGSELSGSAVSVRQSDTSQMLDPVAGELAAGAAISASLSTGIDTVLGSLGSTVAITADLAAAVAVESTTTAAARIGASLAMRSAVLDAMQARGSLELIPARTARARRPMTQARAQRPQIHGRAVARPTTCKAAA